MTACDFRLRIKLKCKITLLVT